MPSAVESQSFITPIGMVFTLVMGLLLLILPRKYAPLTVLAMVCYMPMGIRLVIGGLNFTMIRVLLAFGLARMVLRGEYRGIVLNAIDKIFLTFTVVSIFAYAALYGGAYEAFKYKLGQAYDGFGYYFLFRGFIRDWEDAVQLVKLTAILLAPLAAEMVMEWLTLRNLFAVFGGARPEVWVRDGTPRCQGPFGHPILAGTLGATLLPWFAGLLFLRRHTLIALVGIVSAGLIVVTAGSSGPLMAAVSAGVAFCLWPIRRHMQLFRWGISLLVVALHFVMKAPVWFLVGRLSVHNSSDGFHRAMLIDKAIKNFGEWWLVGVKDTSSWGYFMFDVTNQYILAGVQGGVLSMALFIAIIVRCFRGVGRLQRVPAEQSPEGLPILAWALGAGLMAHVSSFIAVSYFDQNQIMWYALLAVIAALCSMYLDRRLGVRYDEEPVASEPELRLHRAYS